MLALMVCSFQRGQKVVIKDYPFGNPTKIIGEVVGVLESDFYNVKILSGLNEGQIISYKYWFLQLENKEKEE